MTARSTLRPTIVCSQAPPLLADQRGRGQRTVLEVDLVELPSHERGDAAHFEARRRRGHHEGGQAVGAGARGASHDQDVIRLVGAGAPGLLATEDVPLRGAGRPEPDRRHVRSCAGLGDAERLDAPARDAREDLVLLRFAAEAAVPGAHNGGRLIGDDGGPYVPGRLKKDTR